MTEADALPPSLAEQLDAAACGFGIAGLAVALVAPGRRACWVNGVEAEGSTRPVSGQTWFSLASTAKHISAVAMLELAQQGRVDLTVPLERYLHDLPAHWHGRSVLSLMQHTSGLPEYLAYEPGEAVPESRADFMRVYGHLAPAFAPGEGWIYTNTNYILLGFLIAQLSGQPFTAAVQTLFDREGCRGATVASPAWTREANAAAAGPQARDEASARREVIGDGDASFTVQGAADWLDALLGGRLLVPALLATMFTPATLATGRIAPYACGWFVDQMAGKLIGHHGGHYDGWTAMALLVPALGCGVVVMTNQAPGHTRHVRHLAVTALEGFAPGSTPLALPVLHDDDAALTTMIRSQLLRRDGVPPERDCFADELRRVIDHGSRVRGVPSLWTGVEPRGFELVEVIGHGADQHRRYRITYAERTEHLLVGITGDRRIYWVWPL